MKKLVYILLGSNLGDREKHLNSATQLINNISGVDIIDCSRIYSSPAYQMESDTPSFLNQAVRINCSLAAFELLSVLEEIEQTLGRTEKGKNLSRIIDLDILLFADDIFKSDKLTIPHPGLLNRPFALIPLVELDPKIIHPVTQKSLSNYISDKDFRLVTPKEENAVTNC